MRLPGTVNIPTAEKLKGRTKLVARLVSFDDEAVYPIDQFEKVPQVAAGTGQGTGTGLKVEIPSEVMRVTRDDLESLIPDERLRLLIYQGDLQEVEGPKERDDSRSAWFFDAVCSMVRANLRALGPRRILLGPPVFTESWPSRVLASHPT